MNEENLHYSWDILNAYLDEELEESKSSTLSAHLQTCERCRSELGEINALVNALTALEDETLGRDLTDEVLSSLPAARRFVQPAFPFWLAAAQLAAAVVFLVIIEPSFQFNWYPQAIGFELPTWLHTTLLDWTIFCDEIIGFSKTWIEDALDFASIPAYTAALSAISPTLIITLAGSAAAAWLIGNSLLFRHRLGVKN